MTAALALLLCALLPLALVPLVALPATRRLGLALAPWSAPPALLLALRGTIETESFTWLLLGLRVGLDDIGRVFLLFTAALWWLAGLFGRTYLADDARRPRFFAFYLAAQCGNLGLIVAQDIAGFYLFFALLTFAAYGLVVHTGSDEARRAGTVYIVLAIIGEMLLLAAFLLAAQAAQSIDLSRVPAAVAQAPARGLIVGLLLTGFGVKAGVLVLHVWLPLAHPVAPTPASAVLSGAMIKAGLLGWLRFLPLGQAALPDWGALCVLAGFAAAFYAALVGLAQTNPKTVLAYSSISQMGLMTALVGAALLAPEAAALTLTAVVVFAVHHGLAKGALFLSVGVGGGPFGLLRLGQALAVLALAGAPWTSGATAKYLLKGAFDAAPGPWPAWMAFLLPLSSFATALLLLRFMVLVFPTPGRWSVGRWLPWLLSVSAVVLAVPAGMPAATIAGAGWEGLLPLVAAVVVAVLARALPARLRGWRVPPGDVLTLATRAGIGMSWRMPAGARRAANLAAATSAFVAQRRRWPQAPALRADLVAGTAFVFLVVLFFLLLVA